MNQALEKFRLHLFERSQFRAGAYHIGAAGIPGVTPTGFNQGDDAFVQQMLEGLFAAILNFGAVMTFNITHLDFQTAATQKSNLLFTIPARQEILMFAIEPLAQFAGSFSKYEFTAGPGAGTDNYLSAYDLQAAIPGTDFAKSTLSDLPSIAAGTDVYLTATATGANTNTSTAGALTAYAWLRKSLG